FGEKHGADEQPNQDHAPRTVTGMNQPRHSALTITTASQQPIVSNKTRSTALTRNDHVHVPAGIRKTLSGPALKKCEIRPAINARPSGISSSHPARGRNRVFNRDTARNGIRLMVPRNTTKAGVRSEGWILATTKRCQMTTHA